MSQVFENVIEQALKRLESVREHAVAEAERTCSEARDQLAILREISERDVFKDAILLAVGEAYLGQVRGGDRAYVQGLGSGGASLTIVQSQLEERRSPDEQKSYRVIFLAFEEKL